MFWNVFGVRKEYSKLDKTKRIRLFQCSNSKGTFKIWEINGFAQDDLDNEDVMMLDVHHDVYMWIGNKANEIEKRFSLETVLDYVKVVEGRNVPAVYVIQAGREPPSFTTHFHGWDSKKANVNKQVFFVLVLKFF